MPDVTPIDAARAVETPAEDYVVPTVLSLFRREKARRLEKGDGIVFHGADGSVGHGVVLNAGSRKVPIQVAGGRVIPAIPVKWPPKEEKR